jgi:hypothetical protein
VDARPGKVVLVSTSELARPGARAELAALAPRIRERLKRTADDIVAVGLDLLRAKELLSHGSFGPWLEAEFGLSHRSATQFMRAADRFGNRLEAVASLPSGVLLELASPSVPEELVDEVLEGRTPPTVTAVRDAVRRARRSVSQPRASRDVVQALWDLPDDVEGAAEALAEAVGDEYDGKDDGGFLLWAVETFRRAAELLDARLGESA